MARKFAVGDRIKFAAPTRHGAPVATRKVVGVDHLGRPLVRFHGWDNFIVHPSEVLEVLSA